MSAVRVVGVHPRAGLERRAGLFAALSEAFTAVRFEPRETGAWSGLDALIELGGDAEARAAAAAGVPSLAALSPEREKGTASEVLLAESAGLDRRLRGQTLPDVHLPEQAETEAPAGVEVLATAGGRALWTRAGRLDAIAVSPRELEPGEALRARLGRDRSLALLPLLELLRALTVGERWQPPPLRASFLLDDPNLHWPSYGYLKLPQLAHHATEHEYHLALAMVPIDARFAHPAAARLVRERDSLSLLVHGNDHFGGELGEAGDEARSLTLAAQAQRRIDAFERRTGVPVSRVMAPPHERCSASMAQALSRTGFDAITMTRPYPWLSTPPRHWLTAPAEVGALAGWGPVDRGPQGLPVLLRHPFAERHCSGAELALRAYLGQPLVMYGHHDDLADGLDVLARRTAQVRRLGEVRWCSLGQIAAGNVEHRRSGELLRLRPHTRRVEVDVPEGVTRVVVEPPLGFDRAELVRTPTGTAPVGEPFAVSGPGSLELRLEIADAIDPGSVPPPPWRPWPIARRIAGEARDRAVPVARRLGVRA
jgi:hypothetical protein